MDRFHAFFAENGATEACLGVLYLIFSAAKYNNFVAGYQHQVE